MHSIRSILSGDQPQSTPVASKRGRSRPSLGASLTAIPVKREESRLTNHRAEDRQSGVIDSTRIHFRRRAYDARVINVSSHGAMIDCAIEPHIGDRLDIELAEGERGACVVRWLREGRIGLEFAGYSLLLGRSESGDFVFRRSDAVEEAPPERAPRQTLVWMGNLHSEQGSFPVRLHNVSAGGAMVDAAEGHALAEDAEVMLDLSGVGMLKARVRWSADGRLGLGFDGEFDPAMLSGCARAAQPAPEGTTWLKPAYLETELSPDSPWAARWETLKPSDLL